MTSIKRTFAVLAIALSAVSIASATPVTGSISIAGNDTFNSTGINFNPSTGTVTQASGTLATFAPTLFGNSVFSYGATLTSFSFANATGVKLFTVDNSFILPATSTASFTITSLIPQSTNPSLYLTGTGYFNQTGYDQTSGTFSLTSSTTGQITGFQLVSSVPAAATPEPSSLVLLGTGLVGAAGTMMRRRKLAA